MADPDLSAGPRPAAWHHTAVVYQVYLRSFADGTGDGIGDVAQEIDLVRDV